jgi:hypothetical protein
MSNRIRRIFPIVHVSVLAAALLASTCMISPAWGAQTAAKPQPKPPLQSETAAIDPAKLADLQKLFEVSGAKKNVHEMIGVLLSTLKPQIERSLPPGDRSEQVVNVVLKKIGAIIDSDEFFLHLAQIYDTYFTDDDVKDLVKFYESPAGKHFAAVMPQITQQFARTTQQWMAERIPKTMEELSNEYPELKGQPPASGAPGKSPKL